MSLQIPLVTIMLQSRQLMLGKGQWISENASLEKSQGHLDDKSVYLPLFPILWLFSCNYQF
jgi:hypothetical protein